LSERCITYGSPQLVAGYQSYYQIVQTSNTAVILTEIIHEPGAFKYVSTEKLHVVERFRRTGPDTLQWEITIDDPGVWTRQWTAMIPLRSSKKAIY
jgi:hypothetical protein